MLNKDCSKSLLGQLKTITLGGDEPFWDYIGVSIIAWQTEGEIYKPEQYCFIPATDDEKRLRVRKCLDYIKDQNEWSDRCSRYSLEIKKGYIRARSDK